MSQEKIQKIHKVVSRDEWRVARMELLEEEKDLFRRKLSLAKKRQDLPWEKIEADYAFETTKGKVAFSELFGDNATLIVEHFMFQGGENGCPLCSFFLDSMNGIYEHLKPRASFAAIAIGPPEELEKVGIKKGWKFPLVSSVGTTFNEDFGVSWSEDDVKNGRAVYNYNRKWEYTSAEAPGISVFKKLGNGSIYHTYSVYAAGLSDFTSVFSLLDIIPEGRNETGRNNMWWIKHKEDY